MDSNTNHFNNEASSSNTNHVTHHTIQGTIEQLSREIGQRNDQTTSTEHELRRKISILEKRLAETELLRKRQLSELATVFNDQRNELLGIFPNRKAGANALSDKQRYRYHRCYEKQRLELEKVFDKQKAELAEAFRSEDPASTGNPENRTTGRVVNADMPTVSVTFANNETIVRFERTRDG